MKKMTLAFVALCGVIFFTSCTKAMETPVSREADMLKSGNATVFVQSVNLSGGEEVPSVMTTAKGVAILRLTSDGILKTRINISDLEEGDELLFAHIHFGARGQNGGVFLGIADSKADFGKEMVFQLTPDQVETLKNAPLYVNVHSMKYPSGVVRGQIR
jgi:hypothetical protein